MKIILSGVTGFIGSEVLRQCQQDPTITSVIALTRHPLLASITKDSKITEIILEDFNVYRDDVVKEMEGADACIWSLGTKEGRPDIEIDYPMAFCKAFAPVVARQQKPFRYIHCSARLAETDQEKCLLFCQNERRIKGMAELLMMDFEHNKLHEGLWQTYIVKPSVVLPKKGEKCDFRWFASAFIDTVAVDELAAAMIDIVEYGSEVQVSMNGDIVMRGRAVLDRYRRPREYNCGFM